MFGSGGEVVQELCMHRRWRKGFSFWLCPNRQLVSDDLPQFKLGYGAARI